MNELNKIKEDLKEIKYYFLRKPVFDKSTNTIGKNKIYNKLQKYNKAMCEASPVLYDIYVSLYMDNVTQNTLSSKLGYRVEYVSSLNKKLLYYLKDYFNNNKEVA